MNAERKQSNKGQILVMFALGLIGLLAVGALVVDGGQTFVHRRQAQAAADAGAMAGGYAMCNGGTNSTAISAALDYATNNNLADENLTTAIIETETVNGKPYNRIRVNTIITQQPFLAHLLGFTASNIPATASAGCFSPSSARGLLPIAWACKQPVGGGEPSNSEYCQIRSLDWAAEMKPALVDCNGLISNPTKKQQEDIAACLYGKFNYVYMFMDDMKIPKYCDSQPGGTVNCDLTIPPDGIDDIGTAGDRAWLYIDPSINNIKKAIGNKFTVYTHAWYEGKSGVDTAVIKEIGDELMYQPTYLPVFNAMCDKYPLTTPACMNIAHSTTPPGLPLLPGEKDIVPGDKKTYYHIIAFTEAFVTCVVDPQGDCPGNKKATQIGLFDKKTKSVEGYFIRGYPADLTDVSPGGMDLGIYFPSLTQ